MNFHYWFTKENRIFLHFVCWLEASNFDDTLSVVIVHTTTKVRAQTTLVRFVSIYKSIRCCAMPYVRTYVHHHFQGLMVIDCFILACVVVHVCRLMRVYVCASNAPSPTSFLSFRYRLRRARARARMCECVCVCGLNIFAATSETILCLACVSVLWWRRIIEDGKWVSWFDSPTDYYSYTHATILLTLLLSATTIEWMLFDLCTNARVMNQWVSIKFVIKFIIRPSMHTKIDVSIFRLSALLQSFHNLWDLF